MNTIDRILKNMGITKPISIIEELNGFKKKPLVNEGWIEATKLNGISIDKKNDKFSINYIENIQESLNEKKDYVFENKGGIIVFSTTVNAVYNNNDTFFNKVKNWFAKHYESLMNRLKSNDKINKVLSKHNEVQGFSVGNFFKGVYKAKDGSLYDETSLSVEIIGIEPLLLEIIASEMCIEFKQESALVKDYETGEIYLVNKENPV